MITILKVAQDEKAKLDFQPILPGDVENTFADINKLNKIGVKLTHKD